jgi:hypothetical protein
MVYTFSCDITIKQYWSASAADEATARRVAATNAGVDESEMTLIEVCAAQSAPRPPARPVRAYRDRYTAYDPDR